MTLAAKKSDSLHEASAQFYRERFRVTGFYVLSPELAQILDRNLTGETLVDSIHASLNGKQAVSMIQVPDALRRRLWEQIEHKLYDTGRLRYPILVIGFSENPGSVALRFTKIGDIPLKQSATS